MNSNSNRVDVRNDETILSMRTAKFKLDAVEPVIKEIRLEKSKTEDTLHGKCFKILTVQVLKKT